MSRMVNVDAIICQAVLAVYPGAVLIDDRWCRSSTGVAYSRARETDLVLAVLMGLGWQIVPPVDEAAATSDALPPDLLARIERNRENPEELVRRSPLVAPPGDDLVDRLVQHQAVVATQRAAVAAVASAIRHSGAMPEYHRTTLTRHRNEWPTLWEALDRLITTVPE